MKRIVSAAVLLSLVLPLGLFAFCKSQKTDTAAALKAESYFEKLLDKNGPVTKEDGSPFTIAYVDIDPYPASGEMLYYLIEQLMKEGWITGLDSLPFEPGNTDARELVRYLAGQDLGPYIRFLSEAAWYLGVDTEAVCKKELSRLLEEQKLDLILCMGTWPGIFVQSMNLTEIPVMVYFCVDPVGKGLSHSTRYSGRSNWWCHVNYTVYNNQMQFYYDNLHFQKLGVVYYDDIVGAMRAYRESADKNGFEIEEIRISALTGTEPEEIEAYYTHLQEVFSRLIRDGVDCFILGTDIIKDESRIKEQIQPFLDAGIPVAAQNGEYYVREGALMTVTASDAVQEAPFLVDTMAAIFHGAVPGELNQEFFTPPYLSMNLNTAQEIGYQVPEHLILSSDRLYAGGSR